MSATDDVRTRVRDISSVSLLCILNILADISWRLYHLRISPALIMPLLITELLSESVRTEVDARELLPSKTARSDDIKGFGRSGAGFGRPLPRSVHLPFIIDAVLREAPFVTGKRMQTWRSIIQSQDFQNL